MRSGALDFMKMKLSRANKGSLSIRAEAKGNMQLRPRAYCDFVANYGVRL